MSFNGDGTFSPPSPEFPAVAGTIIYAADWNAVVEDIATGFNNTVTRDGQSPALANLSMGGFKLQALATGVANTDAVNLLQAFFDATYTRATLAGLNLTVSALTTTFTGNTVNLTAVVTAVATQLPGNNSTRAASTEFVQGEIAAKAPLASPAFTGIPTAPTAAVATSTAQLATTEFVMTAAFNAALPAQAGNAGKYVTTNGTTASWGVINTMPAQLIQLLNIN